MVITEFKSISEGRQSTISHIIKTKAKIKILETEIKGMVDDTKKYLLDNKIGFVQNEQGVNLVYIEDSKSAPSFKQVYEKVKDKLSIEDQATLETAFNDGYKEVSKIMFNY